MRRENCLVNCEIIFHISAFEPANSTKSLHCVCRKTSSSFGAGIVLLGAANGCYLWKKNAFVLMEDNGFYTWLSSAHLLCWSPAGFLGSCFVSPSSHALWGMLGNSIWEHVWFQRRELLCACSGEVDGDTVGWLGHRELLPGPFWRGVLVW